MKADPFQIGDVRKNPKRFVVPIYQRTDAWKIKPHLETFFDPVEAKAEQRLKSNGGFVSFRPKKNPLTLEFENATIGRVGREDRDRRIGHARI